MSYAVGVITQQLRNYALARERRRRALENAAWAVLYGVILGTLLAIGAR